MATTLDDVLIEVGGYVDQEAATPTSTDLTLRINYANRALRRWEAKYDWEELITTAELNITYASCASVSLPSDFLKPMSALYVYESTAQREYPIIGTDERFAYADSDRICFVMGNISAGFILRVPKGLASGASAVIDYKAIATQYTAVTDSVLVRDPNYLTQSIIADVLESRGDARFQGARFDAEQSLAGMVEDQNAGNRGKSRSIPTPQGFIIGED